MADAKGETCNKSNRTAYGICDRPASVERDGQWYCWQHDPERIWAKRSERIEARIRQTKAEEEAFDRRLARRRLEERAGIEQEQIAKLSDEEVSVIAELGGLKSIFALSNARSLLKAIVYQWNDYNEAVSRQFEDLLADGYDHVKDDRDQPKSPDS